MERGDKAGVGVVLAERLLEVVDAAREHLDDDCVGGSRDMGAGAVICAGSGPDGGGRMGPLEQLNGCDGHASEELGESGSSVCFLLCVTMTRQGFDEGCRERAAMWVCVCQGGQGGRGGEAQGQGAVRLGTPVENLR